MSDGTQIIVFASQKGGSGKTTLSGHLAVQAERSGAGPVALIDTDPQGSLAKWWNARDCEAPAFAQVSVPNLQKDIATLRDAGFRLIIIDTPPAVTSAIAEVITHADLVVLPTRPSPHDLRAVGPTVDIVEYQKKPLVFVINAATARARITGETAVALSQHGTVAPITLHQRVDFAASMIDGRTVGEVNENSRSAIEVAELWKYLADRLLRLRNDLQPSIRAPLKTYENGLLTPMSDSELPEHRRVADIALPPPAAACAASSGKQTGESVTDTCSPKPNTSDPAIRNNVIVTPQGSDGAGSRQAGPSTKDPQNNDVFARPNASPANGSTGGWDGVERRKFDSGPPLGVNDRRRPRPSFGRREPV